MGKLRFRERVQKIAWPEAEAFDASRVRAKWYGPNDLRVRYPPTGNAVGVDQITTQELIDAIHACGAELIK